MSISLYAYLAFYLVVSVIVVQFAARMYRNYRYRFLFYFVVFLVSSYLYGCMDILSNHFAVALMRFQADDSVQRLLVQYTFRFLALPFLVASVYSFILMVMEILSDQLSVRLRFLFWGMELAAVIAFLVVMVNYADTGNPDVLPILVSLPVLFSAGHYALLSVLLVWMVVQLRQEPEDGFVRQLKWFAWLYVAMFAMHILLVVFLKDSVVVCYGAPMVAFLMHVPPLAGLWSALIRYVPSTTLEKTRPPLALDVFRKHGITEREQEVARLVGQGKSNREIEEALFISIKTVKTHLYNIYRKLGINSRYQLIQLLQHLPMQERMDSNG